MSQQFNKLVTLLKELFQLDQPDLDFGLYRIMHAKSGEITQFLETDLLPQVEAELSKYKSADKADLAKDLEKARAQTESLGMNPDDSPKVQEMQAAYNSSAVDIAALESEVYDHLYSFFRRYYHEGDFLSKRVYKQGVYAIPYEGEEVKLHWANKDQYYIKTSEYLRDYAFRLCPEDEAKPMRVHFKLVDASEGEHGNVKATEGKDRVFILAPVGESGHDFLSVENDELSIAFEYRPATMEDWAEETQAEATPAAKKKPPVQSVLLAQAAKSILGATQADFRDWIAELSRKHVKADGGQADYSRLEAHLRRYSARNTFDYFIHKDLGGFLKRELDFYIKNEVMHLDDIENETVARAEQYLSKIKVIRKIAGKLIAFLAQLEDFQKKLWLKKKFVVETNYCITLDRIPEEFYPEIVANEAQREEWVKLFAIDEIEASTTSPKYTIPLTETFLKANTSLVLDTRHFSLNFSNRVLDELVDLDETSSGTLIHSENLQALRLIEAKSKKAISCIYIDPPFNLGQNGDYLYRTDYKDSTWATLLNDRISLAHGLLNEDGKFYLRCDDNGNFIARSIIDEIFGNDGFQYEINVQRIRKNVTKQGRISLPLANDSLFLAFRTERTELSNPYLKLDQTRESYWRRIDDSAGFRNPPERTIFGKVFYPYKRNAHFKFSQKRVDEMIADGRIKLTCKTRGCNFEHTSGNFERCPQCGSEEASPKYLVDATDVKILDTNWMDVAGYSSRTGFSTENAESLLDRALEVGSFEEETVMDFFAGSGTTLAVAQKKKRKWIGVEMGEQFWIYILPRLKATLSETGNPAFFKYASLESYEDALNNLEPRRDDTQQDLLSSAASQGADGLKEQYMLRYMLDVETRESPSLLNIQAFSDPTAYKLKVKRPGSDESQSVNVDLLETFNYLIGLTVEHIAAPQIFSAEFERDDEKRLKLTGRLKQDADGPYWFRTVSGTTPDGQKTLVIWRKLTGTPEEDNLVLDEWFTRQGYSTKDSEFQLIYVNGDCTLENLKTAEDTWKVRLLEEDFHRLMFDTEGL